MLVIKFDEFACPRIGASSFQTTVLPGCYRRPSACRWFIKAEGTGLENVELYVMVHQIFI